MKYTKQLLALVALLVVVAGILIPALQVYATDQAVPARQEIGTNLLANPGFEGIGKPLDNSLPNYGNWTRDTFTGATYGEIFTPEGWVTWWQEGDFKRPECKVIPNEHPFNASPTRIYEGYYAGMCFTFYGKQNAGYFQVVRNVPPNSEVQGSFYAHAWACGEDEPPLSCGDVNGFYFRVGIDPNGGTDPFSANIIWSDAYYNRDQFGLVGPVKATVGSAGVATLFIQAYGKWQLKHNDAYFDNAALILMTQGTPSTETAAPPPPTSEVVETVDTGPYYTPTPLPDGSIVHIVVEGDTLFGLAFEYDVYVDDLREYNAGTLGPNDMLSIGQQIVIKPGTGNAPAPTATLAPDATPAADVTPQAPTAQETPGSSIPAAPAEGTASLCVVAYEDINKDMFRQSDQGEMPLPNAEIALVGTAGPIGDPYRTDGIREPYCFENLAPGSYILRHTPPSGYTTNDGPWNIPLVAGQRIDVELGYTRDASASASDPAATEAPAEEETQPSANATQNPDKEQPEEDDKESGDLASVLSTILRISGIIVVILAVVIGVLFFIARRPL